MAKSETPRKRRKVQGVTMMDVAERAGVSPSTVSLFFRNPDAVSAKAGNAVRTAVRDLNYAPNRMAGGLASASSPVVGVIVPSIRNAFFAETIASLQRGLDPARLQIMLGQTEYDQSVEDALVRTTLSWAPAALVVAGTDHSAATRQLLKASGVPVVEIWELGGETPLDMAVGFDHREVGAAAARHLASRARRSLVFLSGRVHEDKRAASRAEGFLAEAKALGLPARHFDHPAPATTELGGILFNRVLAELGNEDAVGIGCSNDHIALGVLFEAQRQARSIPGDYAVMGFGDLEFASSAAPALSTIRPFGDVIGSETARLILGRRAGLEDTDRTSIIDTGFRVVQRQTT
ncbi:LacI family DNA-binding transcriptional regulator [Pelagibacterium sediminicola]|uniref:LacI family DNA-binding transcriptional regulator n=1 Tax=Pelagibacterium sediminicola TaxID=2248761 RepID=UPI001FE421DE|nr:LacI family DNA-binding transcriptional regulator [Pelagibacterium sediminicola]